MGSVDKTLFTLNHVNDFLLVQICVDDIIFGGSSHVLVSSFQEMVGVPDVHDGRINLFLSYLSQGSEARYLHTSSQVPEGPKKEV
jgi:hypothetical protein